MIKHRFLVALSVLLSMSSASYAFEASCAGSPSGFSVALLADAGTYAKQEASLQCKNQCQTSSKTRVITQRALTPGQSFSFVSDKVGGFGARGTVAAELCENGKIYRGEKNVKVSFLKANGEAGESNVDKSMGLPTFQFTTPTSGDRVWTFTLKDIKA